MHAETEAAALIRSGAAYPRRVGLREADGSIIFAGLKPGAFSLYFGDLPAFHFDLEGRWVRALIEGVHYLKDLDGTVEAIERFREEGGITLRRRRLPFAEARDLDDFVRRTAIDLSEALESGRLERIEPPQPEMSLNDAELRGLLDRIASWDDDAWFRHRETYLGTYGPWPFLPPTCPAPIVLQASLGDLGGRAFGGAAPAEHYLRSPAEFEEHARTVARLLGRRTASARGVVIGGADLLRRPASEVAPYLEIAAETFPIRPIGRRPRLSDRPIEEPILDGLYAFLDDFAPPRPDREGFDQLRAWGLRHVDLGVESGDPEIRGLFAKTWADDDLRDLAAELKAAGVGVGVVLPVGPGGAEGSDRHLAKSVELIASLGLAEGDLVYLVDLGEIAEGTRPTSDPAEQRTTLRAELNRTLAGCKVKVVPYSLAKQ